MEFETFVIFTLTLLLCIFIFSRTNKEILGENRCSMTYSIPKYIPIHSFKQNYSSQYTLYGMNPEIVNNINKKKKTLLSEDDRYQPVLFIPGHLGDHKQARSVEEWTKQKQKRKRKNNKEFVYFTVDFHGDLPALHASVIQRQANYMNAVIKFLNSPNDIIIIAHSYGGIVARTMFMLKSYEINSVKNVITLGSPHMSPPWFMDHSLDKFYSSITKFWENSMKIENVYMLSISGGYKDFMVTSDSSDIHSFNAKTYSITTMDIEKVGFPVDHLCLLWCEQVLKAVTEILFLITDDVVDANKKVIITKRNLINRFVADMEADIADMEADDSTQNFSTSDTKNMWKMVGWKTPFLITAKGYGHWIIPMWTIIGLLSIISRYIVSLTTFKTSSNLTQIAEKDFYGSLFPDLDKQLLFLWSKIRKYISWKIISSIVIIITIQPTLCFLSKTFPMFDSWIGYISSIVGMREDKAETENNMNMNNDLNDDWIASDCYSKIFQFMGIFDEENNYVIPSDYVFVIPILFFFILLVMSLAFTIIEIIHDYLIQFGLPRYLSKHLIKVSSIRFFLAIWLTFYGIIYLVIKKIYLIDFITLAQQFSFFMIMIMFTIIFLQIIYLLIPSQNDVCADFQRILFLMYLPIILLGSGCFVQSKDILLDPLITVNRNVSYKIVEENSIKYLLPMLIVLLQMFYTKFFDVNYFSTIKPVLLIDDNTIGNNSKKVVTKVEKQVHGSCPECLHIDGGKNAIFEETDQDKLHVAPGVTMGPGFRVIWCNCFHLNGDKYDAYCNYCICNCKVCGGSKIARKNRHYDEFTESNRIHDNAIDGVYKGAIFLFIMFYVMMYGFSKPYICLNVLGVSGAILLYFSPIDFKNQIFSFGGGKNKKSKRKKR